MTGTGSGRPRPYPLLRWRGNTHDHPLNLLQPIKPTTLQVWECPARLHQTTKKKCPARLQQNITPTTPVHYLTTSTTCHLSTKQNYRSIIYIQNIILIHTSRIQSFSTTSWYALIVHHEYAEYSVTPQMLPQQQAFPPGLWTAARISVSPTSLSF